ncbi:MAG: nucleotidyltransferase domain-containing protein [Gemmatimonadota bacterium]
MLVWWLDRDEAVRRVAAAARALVQGHPEVQEVYLFGSLARGEACPGSDADVLVVLAETTQSFTERAPAYSLEVPGLSCDVLAYTATEIESMRAGGNGLVTGALREGIRLAGR